MKLGIVAFTAMFALLLFISWVAYETTHSLGDALRENVALNKQIEKMGTVTVQLLLDEERGDAILVVNGVTREYIPKLCPAQKRL